MNIIFEIKKIIRLSTLIKSSISRTNLSKKLEIIEMDSQKKIEPTETRSRFLIFHYIF